MEGDVGDCIIALFYQQVLSIVGECIIVPVASVIYCKQLR